eukprot:6282149-Pyramimonas_sp.AAC.1
MGMALHAFAPVLSSQPLLRGQSSRRAVRAGICAWYLLFARVRPVWRRERVETALRRIPYDPRVEQLRSPSPAPGVRGMRVATRVTTTIKAAKLEERPERKGVSANGNASVKAWNE